VQKFGTVEFRAPRTNSLVNSLLIEVFKGLKHDDIKRLGKVCGMWNQTEYNDLIFFTVMQEFVGHICPVAVDKKEFPRAFLTTRRIFVKMMSLIEMYLIIKIPCIGNSKEVCLFVCFLFKCVKLSLLHWSTYMA
jgi:hypothetical protein